MRKSRNLDREYGRLRYATNRDKIRAQQKAYYDSHPEYRERIKARAAQWSKANRERSRESKAKSAKLNPRTPESSVVYCTRRRARQRVAPGNGISKAQWLEVLEEHGGRCAFCARQARLTMDHIEPLARGGAHDISNAAAACKSCNSKKGTKPLLLWLMAA